MPKTKYNKKKQLSSLIQTQKFCVYEIEKKAFLLQGQQKLLQLHQKTKEWFLHFGRWFVLNHFSQ